MAGSSENSEAQKLSESHHQVMSSVYTRNMASTMHATSSDPISVASDGRALPMVSARLTISMATPATARSTKMMISGTGL